MLNSQSFVLGIYGFGHENCSASKYVTWFDLNSDHRTGGRPESSEFIWWYRIATDRTMHRLHSRGRCACCWCFCCCCLSSQQRKSHHWQRRLPTPLSSACTAATSLCKFERWKIERSELTVAACYGNVPFRRMRHGQKEEAKAMVKEAFIRFCGSNVTRRLWAGCRS